MSAPRSGRDAMKLVIFDVDGTLVDSQHFIVEAQTRAFAAHGLPAPSRAEMLSIVGLSLVQAFEQLVPDGPAASLAQAYRDAWSVMRLDPDYADEMYPGAVEAVNALAQRDDLLLGIATGKSLRGVHHLFDERGWHGRFATVQTSDGHPSKPHPAMVLKALAETGLAPADALMIGDTSYDMAMGRAAGVRTLGVTWGYHTRDQLIASGAERLVESYEDLMAVLASGQCWD
jgi:phosphoglycolate phosphatase